MEYPRPLGHFTPQPAINAGGFARGKGKGRGKGKSYLGGQGNRRGGTGRIYGGPVAAAGMAADMAPCPSISTLPPGLQQILAGAAPVTPPVPLREEPLPQTLAPLQRSLQLHMDSIARLDATIHAMCLRRAQVQAAAVAELLCLFEILAQHTSAGSLLMQGGNRGVASAGLSAPAAAASSQAGPDVFSPVPTARAIPPSPFAPRGRKREHRSPSASMGNSPTSRSGRSSPDTQGRRVGTLGPVDGLTHDLMVSLVELIVKGTNTDAADMVCGMLDHMPPSPSRPVLEAGNTSHSAAARAASPLTQDNATSQVVKRAASQKGEPATTPTSELEARAAYAMSTPQARCRQSPGDILGPLVDAELSPFPHSQLILCGATPRDTAVGDSTHLQRPVVSLVAAEGLGDGVITLEENDELARMGEHDSEPVHVQAQLGFGPILNFTPDPVSPAPAATPDTI